MMGKAVNPLSCEGQIEGGVVMSIGYAVRKYLIDENCKPIEKYGSIALLEPMRYRRSMPLSLISRS